MGRSVNIVTEDVLSENILRALLRENGGHKVAGSYPIKKGWIDGVPQSGYGYIKKNLLTFNKAAAATPFVIVVDRDDRPCPPKTIDEWLCGEIKSDNLIIRIAVVEVEAWLLADKAGLAEFLAVSERAIPDEPEKIEDPKSLIVKIAATSKQKEIRSDMVPIAGGSATTGPYFSRALSSFVRDTWNTKAAAKRSDSLKRAIASIARL